MVSNLPQRQEPLVHLYYCDRMMHRLVSNLPQRQEPLVPSRVGLLPPCHVSNLPQRQEPLVRVCGVCFSCFRSLKFTPTTRAVGTSLKTLFFLLLWENSLKFTPTTRAVGTKQILIRKMLKNVSNLPQRQEPLVQNHSTSLL